MRWSTGILAASLVFFNMIGSAQAFDKASYVKLAESIIQTAISGKVDDVDGMIGDLHKLVGMGKQGCSEFGADHPEHAKMMKLVVDNAGAMSEMGLEEIEVQWHDAEFLTSNGIDVDAIDHFSPALSFMDSVVHPATSIIVMQEYKKSPSGSKLGQVKDELSEVLEHMDHIH